MPEFEQPSLTVYVNGRETEVESFVYQVDHERVASLGGVQPDPKWEYEDAAGHQHRFALDERGKPFLPTLDKKTRYIPCDCHPPGECEGTRQDTYTCKLCTAEVGPRWVIDLTATTGKTIVVRRTYELTFQADAAPPVQCTVQVQGETLRAIGVGRLRESDSTIYSWDEKARYRATYAAELYPLL